MRYTVPQRLNIDEMDDMVTVRFRVDNVYRDIHLTVYADGKEIRRIKKRVMAPGEMEELTLTRSALEPYGGAKEITIALED